MAQAGEPGQASPEAFTHALLHHRRHACHVPLAPRPPPFSPLQLWRSFIKQPQPCNPHPRVASNARSPLRSPRLEPYQPRKTPTTAATPNPATRAATAQARPKQALTLALFKNGLHACHVPLVSRHDLVQLRGRAVEAAQDAAPVLQVLLQRSVGRAEGRGELRVRSAGRTTLPTPPLPLLLLRRVTPVCHLRHKHRARPGRPTYIAALPAAFGVVGMDKGARDLVTHHLHLQVVGVV